MWATQFVAVFETEREARRALVAQQLQEGYLGGRLLSPHPTKPGWKVQSFWPDLGVAATLPEGMRRVYCPVGQWRVLGIGSFMRTATGEMLQ
jgi:hypothetical protein